MKDIQIRKLSAKLGDFEKGFFETMENLHEVNLTVEQAGNLFLNEILFSKTIYVFVAESKADNKIVGTITLIVIPSFLYGGQITGQLDWLSVRKGYENQGIGAMLVKHATEIAKEKRCGRLTLTCGEQNIGFYEKLGWTKYGQQMRDLKNFPY